MPLITQNDEIVIVHSSDIHVDDGYTARAWGGDGNAPLAAVLRTAIDINADVVILAGDIFEHNRLKNPILDQTRSVLSEARLPVVMLPGNHDPLIPGSVWERGELGAIQNVQILGERADTVTFSEYGLKIWGRAHKNYDDINPLAGAPARTARWHIVTGHGHYADERPNEGIPAPSWLFTTEEIEATGADYVALGHWNRKSRVGQGEIPAWYSGSPDLAATVNVVRLKPDGAVDIGHAPVDGVPSDLN
jgi:DNA repair exonuclease SbcCD nuclease subunit